MFRNKCLICNSSDLREILNFGVHNFADTFLRPNDLKEPEKVYPLICELCMDCGQVQLKAITDPLERYIGHDYSYTSSNSKFAREHWEEFARVVGSNVGLSKNGFVVEIGSNDGFLTKQFLSNGNRVLGVDPSNYMAELAEKEGVKTIVGLFNEDVSKEILRKYGRAELVIANNVFNHSNEPMEFAWAVSRILSDNGTFVYEMPYWLISVRDGKFDQVYHEHVSYFTVRSSMKILELAGMYISDVGVVDYHGGSLRVYAKLRKNNEEHCIKAKEMLREEEEFGMFSLKRYADFMDSIIKRRNYFLEKLISIKNSGGKIIAVGAAAKGNTLLTFYNLNSSLIEFVTDASIHKQGKFTPLTRIPITSDEVFKNYDSPYALILSWNISEQVKRILLGINPKIQFISPWGD